MDTVHVNWRAPTLYSECTWHQLSPYIGKMKSSMARSLIEQFTHVGDLVYDPFSGAGTVALEAWISGRAVVAADLSPYAYVLSRAKACPPRTLHEAIRRLDECWEEVQGRRASIDLRSVPGWVRSFFHNETLRDTIAARDVLVRRRQWFLLACLLGILHHWRPAFLSHPSSHTVPYVLSKKYPRRRFPRLYGRREVYPRLLAKVRRAFKRTPEVDRSLLRKISQGSALEPGSTLNGDRVSAIITSPPYMNSLSYARDNRLRLWFLGVDDHRPLESAVSPRKPEFLNMMRALLPKWSGLLPAGAPCVLVLGAVRREGKNHNLPEEVAQLVPDAQCGLRVTGICGNLIPDTRRVRARCRSARRDTILVLRREG